MRRSAASALIAISAGVAACASSAPSGSGPAAPAGPAMAYVLTGPALATYEVTDTSAVQLEVDGNQIRVDVASRVTAAIDLAPASNGLRATVRITTLDGYSSNSMGSSVTIGAGHVPGPAELSVTRDGVVTIVQRPDLSPEFQRVIGAVDLYRRFFLRLPEREVGRGVAWTDTIPLADVSQGLNIESSNIVTSVWERDTTVAGRTLRVITSSSVSTSRTHGNTEGVDIEQNLTGRSTAMTLWDPVRRLVVERRETGDATGTTNLPAMGVTGLPTSIRSTSTLRRVGPN